MAFEEQKAWLEILNKKLDSPIFTAQNYREGKNYRPGFQKIIGKLIPVDHRTIGSNEIVIDLDAKSYAQNYRFAQMIREYLRSQLIPHYCFWSGNKGIHIHIFFESDVNSKDAKKVIKKAVEKNIDIWKELRVEFCKEMLLQSGISLDLFGEGKIIDILKIRWDSINLKSPLIRCCGGANKKVLNDNTIKTNHKTFYDKLPDTKPKDIQYSDVNYPKKVEMFVMSESFVVSVCKRYLDSMDKTTFKELRTIDYKGKWLELPCIQTLLEGTSSGNRGTGARLISIACKLQGLTKTETKSVLKKYVYNCEQIPERFEPEEAYKWADWIFKVEDIFWNCGTCKRLKLCEKSVCEYHKELYKEEKLIFEKGDPIQKIKEVLDLIGAGESNLKLQIFIAFMARFVSPEWFIMIDGPAASGKSFILKNVAWLIGEEGEDWFTYQRMTEASLNRIDPDNWENSVVIIEELQGAKRVVEALRVLISEKQLNLLETVEEKDFDGSKKLVTNEIKHTFKNVLFATCQAEEFDEGDQLKSRGWILNTDVSEDQTKHIMAYKCRSKRGPQYRSWKDNPLSQSLKTWVKHINVNVSIEFPFGDDQDFINLLSSKNLRARRDIDKFHHVIQAITLLRSHLRQSFKDKLGRTVLVSQWEDVKTAIDIFHKSLVATSQGISKTDLTIYKVLATKDINTNFKINDIMELTGLSRDIIYKSISNLKSASFIENLTMPPAPAVYKRTGVVPTSLDFEIDFDSKIKHQKVKIDEFIQWRSNLN